MLSRNCCHSELDQDLENRHEQEGEVLALPGGEDDGDAVDDDRAEKQNVELYEIRITPTELVICLLRSPK